MTKLQSPALTVCGHDDSAAAGKQMHAPHAMAVNRTSIRSTGSKVSDVRDVRDVSDVRDVRNVMAAPPPD
jgi:hypothetical protein